MPGPITSTKPLTSLVLPAYNPGGSVERTWNEVRQFLREAPGDWEALFVCDGCTDGTPARLEALVRDSGLRVQVLSYAPNRGKGYAVRRGLLAARGTWRLFTDVDLAYGWDDILRVAEVLWAGAEVVIASRTHPESRLVLPPRLQGYAYRRYLQSLAFSAVVRTLLPLPQHDTQAGLKGLSDHAVLRLLPALRCDGFGFDCDLLAACRYHGVPVTEVPVCRHYNARVSTTGVRAVARMVLELCHIRRRWRHAPEPLPLQAAVPVAA